jgi:hypothetical protein
MAGLGDQVVLHLVYGYAPLSCVALCVLVMWMCLERQKDANS